MLRCGSTMQYGCISQRLCTMHRAYLSLIGLALTCHASVRQRWLRMRAKVNIVCADRLYNISDSSLLSIIINMQCRNAILCGNCATMHRWHGNCSEMQRIISGCGRYKICIPVCVWCISPWARVHRNISVYETELNFYGHCCWRTALVTTILYTYFHKKIYFLQWQQHISIDRRRLTAAFVLCKCSSGDNYYKQWRPRRKKSFIYIIFFVAYTRKWSAITSAWTTPRKLIITHSSFSVFYLCVRFVYVPFSFVCINIYITVVAMKFISLFYLKKGRENIEMSGKYKRNCSSFPQLFSVYLLFIFYGIHTQRICMRASIGSPHICFMVCQNKRPN